MDIYNCDKRIIFSLICKRTVRNMKRKIIFENGKKYIANLEPIDVNKDTNNKPCTLVWVSYGDGHGSRFSVLGNIFFNDKPLWNDFKTVFHCPVDIERNKKIKKIKNGIQNR